MHNVLPSGKLPADLLRDLLIRFRPTGDRVVLGGAIGEDAAVIDMGDRYLVAKTDPITFATDQIGWYAVHVNVNDLAVTGATPRWFLATVLLPEGRTTSQLVERIFQDIHSACASLRIDLVGGHTEVTHGLDRPIVVGHLIGEAETDGLITTGGARPGDSLLLVRGVAIEGASIIAREKAADLRLRGFEDDFIARVQHFLYEPGISVLCEAQIATGVPGVHSMHDPTEGGVATGLWEIAMAAKVELAVNTDEIPVLPECQRLCVEYGLDPLGLIASGALLLAIDPGDAAELCGAYACGGVACREIGMVMSSGEEAKVWDESQKRLLPRFDVDEITKILD